MIKTNLKIEWMNDWALGHTGRTFYKHRPTPQRDNTGLSRNEQTTIFRLRTEHIALNYHLNRIKPEHPPNCILCNDPYETVNHHLYKCPALGDLRDALLPPSLDPESCLYSSTEQLKKTCQYHLISKSRRAKAQWLLDQ